MFRYGVHPSLVRFGLVLAVAGVALAASGRPAEATHRFDIQLNQLRCVEETDGLGSDEAYAVVYAADLHPTVPESMAIRTRLFTDLESDENHDLRPPVRVWGFFGGARTITNVSNVVLLAAVLESDGSDRALVQSTVQAHLDAILPGLVANYRAGRITRAVLGARLITAMNHALDLARADGGDDRLGSAQEVRPDPATGDTLADVLADAQNGGVEMFYTAIFSGDGGRYRLRFQVTSPAH